MDFIKHTQNIPVFVDLNELDEAPGPNCMSFGFDIKQLTHSVERFGLINPPVITRDREGTPVIITGYRRVIALKSIGSRTAPCIDLSDMGISPFEQLLLNLYENLTVREFNPVEKGMILNRLSGHVQRRDLDLQYARLLQISGAKEMDTLIRIERELDKRTKEYIAFNNLSLKTIGLILEMDIISRSSVLEWISSLGLNLNQQFKFIDYLVDISIKENIKIPNILDHEIYQNLFQDRELNIPQKAKKIIDLLRNRRYPLLSDSEKSFSRKVSALNLPDDIQIQHPPYFESGDYRLEIIFKSGRDLKEKIRALAAIKGLEGLNDPWKG